MIRFSCTIKIKVFADKTNLWWHHQAKEVYIQLSFERYEGKLVLHILSPSV